MARRAILGSVSTLFTPNFHLADRAERAPKMGDFIIRGSVRDEHGSPIEGAAIYIGDEVVFSNAAGEFSLRLTKPQHVVLMVATDEFLSPLHFAVISAPPTATAASEDSVKDILIVLRPVTNGAR